MKHLLIALTLFTTFSYSQHQSLGLFYGENHYKDEISSSLTSSIVGVEYRYMFNDIIGLQGIGQFDVFRANTDLQPNTYRAYAYSIRLEPYISLYKGDLFSFGIHSGYGGMYIWVNEDLESGKERIQQISGGFTVQYALGRGYQWGALKFSSNYFYNLGQEKTLNNRFELKNNSRIINATLGFIVYLD